MTTEKDLKIGIDYAHGFDRAVSVMSKAALTAEQAILGLAASCQKLGSVNAEVVTDFYFPQIYSASRVLLPWPRNVDSLSTPQNLVTSVASAYDRIITQSRKKMLKRVYRDIAVLTNDQLHFRRQLAKAQRANTKNLQFKKEA